MNATCHRSTKKSANRLGRIVAAGVAALVAIAPGSASAEDGPDTAEARRQFEAGVNLLDDPDGAKYEEAYHAFKKAHALSQNPKVLGNVAFCAFHLERDGEAVDAWTAYLRDAQDVDEKERAQIQRDLATLTSTAAKVHIVVKHPAKSFVLVDTRSVTRGPSIENSYPIEGNEIVLRVRPGRHTFKVKAGAMDSTPVDATVEPAAQVTHELTFAPPKPLTLVLPRESPSVAGPVVLAAGGVLALGAGVAAGLLARSKTNEIAGSCPSDVCPPTYALDAERDKARTYGTLADVGFIAGGALASGAFLWWALLPKGGSRPTTAASAMCTGQGCGFQIQRGF